MWHWIKLESIKCYAPDAVTWTDESHKCTTKYKFDGLSKDCSNSTANALELLQPCIKPSTCINGILTIELKSVTEWKVLTYCGLVMPYDFKQLQFIAFCISAHYLVKEFPDWYLLCCVKISNTLHHKNHAQVLAIVFCHFGTGQF